MLSPWLLLPFTVMVTWAAWGKVRGSGKGSGTVMHKWYFYTAMH